MTAAVRPRISAKLVFTIVVLLGTLAGATEAKAYVYWSNSTTLGRANLDASNANQSFVSVSGGAGSAYGVAVDGSHIYWANDSTNTIGRANLDGSGVEDSFITGGNGPQTVAVDGNYIYWSNYNDGTIGRANLNGTGVDQSFINTGSAGLEGVAVDSAHIYWAHLTANSPIGRANINGTGITPMFIPGANSPDGIAVDGNYIYWANTSGNIGRATLDGSVVNQDFITTQEPCGLAIDSGHVYWTNNSAKTIGRANLDGSAATDNYISTAVGSCGVAVDALPAPVVQTGSASSLTQTSAVLSGTVNPGGSVTGYHFEYGTTTAYGNSVPMPDAMAGSDSSAHTVSQTVSGLQPGTTYHFRLVATNGAGTVRGPDQTLTTALAPPVLGSVTESHRHWRVGNALPHVASVKRPPVGTTFRFSVNESVRVRFVFKQRGRKRGTLSFSVGSGAHKVRFAGRISKHKKLKPGRYSLMITATNAVEQRATAKLTFTIVRG